MIAKNDEDELLRSVALQNAYSILVARRRAEQRLDAYLAEAQRLSHTGSFGWSVSTNEIFWSDETFRIFQYDRATKPTVELILQRVHPEDAASVKQTIERARRNGKDFDHEYRLAMPDGSIKHVHVVAHALSDEAGGSEFVGAVMDVTVAKEAEDKIRLIIDTVPGLIWTARPDGQLDFISQRWLNYAGVTFEQKLAQDWGAECHPDDIDQVRRRWRAAVAEGRPFEAETRVRRFDGAYRWFLYRAFPLFDRAGHILGWYGNDMDIHDRKRSEMLLAGEKRVLEMMASGDSRALILAAVCRLFEELSSNSLCSILLLETNGDRLRHGAAPSLPTEYSQAIDGAVIGPSVGSCGTAAYRGEPVIVSDIATDPLWVDYRDLALSHGLRACWSTPILASDGRVLGTFAIAIEREQAEQKLRQAQMEVAHVNRVTTMGQLTASIAHEVNQPLTGVVSSGNACLRWLTNQPANIENARQSVDRIIRDANRASEVVGRVRGLTKKASLQMGWLNVNETVLETVALTRMELEQNRVSLSTQLSDDVPLVWADRIQVQQVFLNLIMNAIEAISALADGPRHLLVSTAKNESNGVLLAVRDSGAGLDSGKLEDIFEAFYTTKHDGMGMGLAVSRSIIEAHGGRLWATPNDPRGAVFQFTLPNVREALS